MFGKLVLAALPLISSALAQSSCTRSATVQNGDFCDTISNKYGVSTFQLALVNTPDITENCDNLKPNSTICLGIQGQDCTQVYTVKAGDTCGWVQEMYGMTKDVLYSNNPQIDADCSNIYVNEVLCVATTKFSYPAFNATSYASLAYTYLPWCDE